jgi:hypothetical protein
MQIRGIPFHEVVAIVERVSRDQYAGNIIIDRQARDTGTRKGGFAGRFIVADSKGPGARRSSSGRRGPYLCWHGFRDVYVALFEAYPAAVIVTSMARYNGRVGFYDNYPATARTNVGSVMLPRYMPALCECIGNVPETAAQNRQAFEASFATNWSTVIAEDYAEVGEGEVEDAGTVSAGAFDHGRDVAWGPPMV